jgi:3-deoxy-D-manno-octulosonate 8-phosphate phosphatase (KDO 8-P phosphatase)
MGFQPVQANQMAKKQKVKFAGLELLVMDVDGVLTDGQVAVFDDGSEGKSFNVLDGHGIRMWRRAGGKCAFLSGRFSKATQERAEQLEIDYCFQLRPSEVQGFEKLPVLKKLLKDACIPAERAAYIGDDLMDLPAMRYVGFGVAVANAVDEVKEQADYVTERRGGEGAVREVIEYILKSSGKWKLVIGDW